MNIDIQQYRISIGVHSSSLVFQSRIPRKVSVFGQNDKKHGFKIKIVNITLISMCILVFNYLASVYSYNEYLTYRSYYSTVKKNNCRQIAKYPQIEIVHYFGFKWSIIGLSCNKLQNIINGNRKTFGFKLAVWNCERGLLGVDGASPKFQDIKNYIMKNKPHTFGIIEPDIFGLHSRRLQKFDTETVKSLLYIPGYSLELPTT